VGALSYLGLSLSEYFQLSSLMAAPTAKQAKAQSCILIWMHGGQSHLDTWDVKGNSGFKPISTNVPGIQISELLPRVSRHMDKLSIIRSMKNESNAATEQMNNLRGRLNSLTDSFTGQTQLAFDEAFNEWKTGADQMLQGLNSLGEFLTNAANTIEETDAQIASQLRS